MTVLIQIHYQTNENKVLRRGSFPIKGRKPEMVANEFWKWIKKESPFPAEMEMVICDGKDITDLVKKLDEAPL